MDAPIVEHITSKTTTHIASESVIISQIVFLCTNAGTTWVMTIKDNPPSPKVPRTWFGPFTLVVPTDGKPTIINFTFPMYMEGGVDIDTATGSTTAGVLDIQMI